VQERDPQSTLAFTRRMLALRNASAALRRGSMTFVEAPAGMLAFERSVPGERLLCIFNLGDVAQRFVPHAPVAGPDRVCLGAITDWTFAPLAAKVVPLAS
jgi:alpha-glucosidase